MSHSCVVAGPDVISLVVLETSLRLHRHKPGRLSELADYLHKCAGRLIGGLLWRIRSVAIDSTEKIARTSMDAISVDIRLPGRQICAGTALTRRHRSPGPASRSGLARAGIWLSSACQNRNICHKALVAMYQILLLCIWQAILASRQPAVRNRRSIGAQAPEWFTLRDRRCPRLAHTLPPDLVGISPSAWISWLGPELAILFCGLRARQLASGHARMPGRGCGSRQDAPWVCGEPGGAIPNRPGRLVAVARRMASRVFAGPGSASRSASPGDKILGSVRGTRTSGAVRDRTDPPCRRVTSPRGTGFTATGVSPRATR